MAKDKDYDYSFSPSKLNKLECARCFYDENKLDIARPRGIFPGLPGGVDRVMKLTRDTNRAVLPANMQRVNDGRRFLGDVAGITKLRNWSSGLQAKLTINGKRVRVIGAFDDIVAEEDGTYSPYDDKTKGDLPKDDGAKYYQLQLDLYDLLLKENGLKPSGKAYLNYHYPMVVIGDEIVFGHALYALTTNADMAIAVMSKAIDILEGKRPFSNPQCEYCQFSAKHYALFLKE
jgi:PD-(D/E)XK nuclease superfamily